MSEARDVLRPTDLGERGHAFWVAMGGPREDNPVRIALIVEAARQLDILERLNQVIIGDDEFITHAVGDDGVIIVRVEKAVGAQRMAASLFQRMATELGSSAASASPNNVPNPTQDAEPDFIDELGARRIEREKGWGH